MVSVESEHLCTSRMYVLLYCLALGLVGVPNKVSTECINHNYEIMQILDIYFFSQQQIKSWLICRVGKALKDWCACHPQMRGSRSRTRHDRAVINCQYSMATFSTAERKRRPHGDRKSTEMSLHLKQTFEAAVMTQLYPRSQIDIYVKVIDR